ncbi:hypothetical protein [Gabonibacter chumensis]|uniref:hypothetical protein n=1 Tax=Gabonibacter chumensis TaxID=2972474 RepID=UPI0025732547|nr:hypothetical protein [Gabonibacter chumensis]MCR9012194.1 hypothetical protein [Gabonibacter chumensis]
MKNKNKITILIALLVLIITFSIISMITSPADIRFSWAGINPWNTVKGVFYMFNRYIRVNAWVNYSLTVLLIAYLWWRIYALVGRFRRRQ